MAKLRGPQGLLWITWAGGGFSLVEVGVVAAVILLEMALEAELDLSAVGHLVVLLPIVIVAANALNELALQASQNSLAATAATHETAQPRGMEDKVVYHSQPNLNAFITLSVRHHLLDGHVLVELRDQLNAQRISPPTEFLQANHDNLVQAWFRVRA